MLPRILDMDPYVTVTDSMEATQTHSSAMAERHGICLYLGGRRLRLESLLLGAIGLFVVSLLALFIAFDVGAEDVERWGYAGLFGFSLLRASSVILPIPGSGMTFAAGGFMNSAWGIPAPVLVGVIAGFAESLGEFRRVLFRSNCESFANTSWLRASVNSSSNLATSGTSWLA